MFGHHWDASETSGPMMARFQWYLDSLINLKKFLKSDPLWQNFLDPRMHKSKSLCQIIIIFLCGLKEKRKHTCQLPFRNADPLFFDFYCTNAVTSLLNEIYTSNLIRVVLCFSVEILVIRDYLTVFCISPEVSTRDPIISPRTLDNGRT